MEDGAMTSSADADNASPASPENAKPASETPAPMPPPEPSASAEPDPVIETEPAPTPDPAPEQPRRSAWQPFTFGGVATFAYASADRVFLVHVLMAFIAGISVLWLVDLNYTPVIVAAMRKMPEEAVIQNGNLEGVETGLLAERRFLSVAIDLRQDSEVGQSADFQIECHQRNVAICPSFRSLAGVVLFSYPQDCYVPIGRTNLEPWWDAWKPVCYAGIVLGVALGLLLAWLILATAYGIVTRLVAYFGDRSLRLGQCWNLAAASLMPGALLMVTAIVLYGLQVVDLIGLSALFVLHLVISWVYLFMAPLRIPRMRTVFSSSANPFAN